MKKTNIYIFIIFVILFFVSCDSSELQCIRVSSNIISETRDVKDFKGVVFNNIGNLILTQGPEYSYTMSGPENVLDLTTTVVENGLLVIGADACFNGSYKVVVEITAPDYDLINLSGVGTIETVGKISGDIIEIEMFGIGDIGAEIVADTLITTISGTGKVSYTGSVIRHELSCAGKYELNSYGLVTEYTSISLTGIGDSYVMANKTLDVFIEGSGNVYYKGSPVIKSEITGTGSVIDKN